MGRMLPRAQYFSRYAKIPLLAGPANVDSFVEVQRRVIRASSLGSSLWGAQSFCKRLEKQIEAFVDLGSDTNLDELQEHLTRLASLGGLLSQAEYFSKRLEKPIDAFVDLGSDTNLDELQEHLTRLASLGGLLSQAVSYLAIKGETLDIPETEDLDVIDSYLKPLASANARLIFDSRAVRVYPELPVESARTELGRQMQSYVVAKAMRDLQVDEERARLFCRARTVPSLRGVPVGELSAEMVGAAQSAFMCASEARQPRKKLLWHERLDISSLPSVDGTIVKIVMKGHTSKKASFLYGSSSLGFARFYLPESGELKTSREAALLKFSPNGICLVGEDDITVFVRGFNTAQDEIVTYDDFSGMSNGRLLRDIWIKEMHAKGISEGGDYVIAYDAAMEKGWPSGRPLVKTKKEAKEFPVKEMNSNDGAALVYRFMVWVFEQRVPGHLPKVRYRSMYFAREWAEAGDSERIRWNIGLFFDMDTKFNAKGATRVYSAKLKRSIKIPPAAVVALRAPVSAMTGPSSTPAPSTLAYESTQTSTTTWQDSSPDTTGLGKGKGKAGIDIQSSGGAVASSSAGARDDLTQRKFEISGTKRSSIAASLSTKGNGDTSGSSNGNSDGNSKGKAVARFKEVVVKIKENVKYVKRKLKRV
ncbi:MAG: hypothetical protein SGCHY_005056 [Lobulomycetales sp.]